MEDYENIIKFLDVAIRSLKALAKESPHLDVKLFYQRETIKVENARRVLRLNYYEYEDYIKTGEYTAPATTDLPICKDCGQLVLHND